MSFSLPVNDFSVSLDLTVSASIVGGESELWNIISRSTESKYHIGNGRGVSVSRFPVDVTVHQNGWGLYMGFAAYFAEDVDKKLSQRVGPVWKLVNYSVIVKKEHNVDDAPRYYWRPAIRIFIKVNDVDVIDFRFIGDSLYDYEVPGMLGDVSKFARKQRRWEEKNEYFRKNCSVS